MKDIEELVKNLNWGNPEHIQQSAIGKLLEVNEEEAVLLAKQSKEICSKSCWYNAANILQEIGYPRNRFAILYLMEWFQDLNWPGVATVVELLNRIYENVLVSNIKVAMGKALKDKDEMWAYGLIYLIGELSISQSRFYDNNLYQNSLRLSESQI